MEPCPHDRRQSERPGYQAHRSARTCRRSPAQKLAAEESLIELAEARDVTIPTLKHYFGSRNGSIAAYFERFGS